MIIYIYIFPSTYEKKKKVHDNLFDNTSDKNFHRIIVFLIFRKEKKILCIFIYIQTYLCIYVYIVKVAYSCK